MRTSRPFILGPFRQSKLIIQGSYWFPTSFAMRSAGFESDLVHHRFKDLELASWEQPFRLGRRRFGLSCCYGKSLRVKAWSMLVRTLPRHWLESHTVTDDTFCSRAKPQKFVGGITVPSPVNFAMILRMSKVCVVSATD
jgi:hypothetical protein